MEYGVQGVGISDGHGRVWPGRRLKWRPGLWVEFLDEKSGLESLLPHGSLEILKGDRRCRTAVTHTDSEPDPPPTDRVTPDGSQTPSASGSPTVK